MRLLTNKYIDVFLVFIFSGIVFTYILYQIGTDIYAHINYIKQINTKNLLYPPNFLYYLIVNILSGFSNISFLMNISAILCLSFAASAKYMISKKIINKLNKNLSEKSVTIFALILFFCFAIPDPFSIFIFDKLYLGHFVPTVWHNSTTIFVFPFAVLLFWKQLQVFYKPNKLNKNDTFIICILVLLNVLIKPSFLFCYVPVTFLFLIFIYKKKPLKEFVFSVIPIFFAAILLVLQYFLIYKLNLVNFQGSDVKSGVVLSLPFEALSNWIPKWYIPISLIFSLLLPLVTIYFYKEIIKYKPFLYSLVLTIVAIFISAFIIETGPRANHGNFTWQAIICVYLLFLSNIGFLAGKFKFSKLWPVKLKIIAFLLILHTISGLFYLSKIALKLSYA